MFTRTHAGIVLGLAAALLAARANGQAAPYLIPIQWNAGDGNWSTAAKWKPANEGPPNSNRHDVLLARVAGVSGYTVTLDDDYWIARYRQSFAGSTLLIDNHTLRVPQQFVITAGQTVLRSGCINAAAGGSGAGYPPLKNAGVVRALGISIINRAIENSGSFKVEGWPSPTPPYDTTLWLGRDMNITNTGWFDITATSPAVPPQPPQPAIVRSDLKLDGGTFYNRPTGFLTIGNVLNPGVHAFVGSLSNQGRVDIVSPTDFSDTYGRPLYMNAGTFNINAPMTVERVEMTGGEVTMTPAGSLTVRRSFRFAGGTLPVNRIVWLDAVSDLGQLTIQTKNPASFGILGSWMLRGERPMTADDNPTVHADQFVALFGQSGREAKLVAPLGLALTNNGGMRLDGDGRVTLSAAIGGVTNNGDIAVEGDGTYMRMVFGSLRNYGVIWNRGWLSQGGLGATFQNFGRLALHSTPADDAIVRLEDGAASFVNEAAGVIEGAGVLAIDPTAGFAQIENRGRLAPGERDAALGAAVGSLTIEGGLDQVDTAVLDVRVDGAAGTADLLTVAGDLTLAGALEMSFLDGQPADLPPGTRIPFLTYGSLRGAFESVISPEFYGKQFVVDYSEPGTLYLVVESIVEPPDDCNGNGVPDELETAGPLSGFGLRLDGVDDDVVVPGFGALIPSTEITVEFWQKVDAAKQQGTLIAGLPPATTNRLFAAVPWSDGQVYWDFGDIAAGGRLTYMPPEPIIGQWQHFALVASQSGNHMAIYRNGVLEATKSGMDPREPDGTALFIGGRGMLNSNFHFGGCLDEVRIWNVARSAEDVRSTMGVRLNGNEPGLLAYWRLDEGQGAVAADLAGSSDGTLNNGPAWLALYSDCNGNGVPDECESDADGDGLPDDCAAP